MDSKVDLSKLMCDLCVGCFQISTCTFTSLQGQAVLVCNKNITSSSLLSSCGTNFEGSPLWSLLYLVDTSLSFLGHHFPKFSFSSYSVFAELISHLGFLVCHRQYQVYFSPLKSRWSDALRARSSTILCIMRSLLAVGNMDPRINPFSLLLTQF